jgi:DNA-binding CsgD family transcriptional regulator
MPRDCVTVVGARTPRFAASVAGMQAGAIVVGRDAELADVVGFVTRHGRGVLVQSIEGEPGSGKTTLWWSGLDAASAVGVQVRSSRVGESEAQFSFAAIGDLLHGVPRDLVAALPDPQRRAVEVALLHAGDEDPVSGHAVAAGFLSVVRSLARAGPTLLAVEDVQWLDAASATVLGFVLRRLALTDGVRMLFTVRTAEGERPAIAAAVPAEQWQHVRLGSLSFGAVQRLLLLRLGWVPSRPVAHRIYELSAGNPLFALELGAALSRRGGEVQLSGALPVPQSLTGLLAAQLERHGAAVERVLVTVDMLADARESVVSTAAGDGAAVENAVNSGLLIRDIDRLRLAHPMLGAVARQRASAAQRRQLHLALADAVADVEERARHLGLGSVPPDEPIAATLVEASAVAARRGSAVAAAQLAEQAWRFSNPTDATTRTDRLLAAAERHLVAGTAQRARDLVLPLLAELAPGRQRAHALLVWALGAPGETPDAVLAQALAHAGPLVRARALHERAFARAVGRLRDLPAAQEWAIEAVGIARATGDPVLEVTCRTTLAWVQALRGENPDPALPDPGRPYDLLPGYDHPDRLAAVLAMWRGDLDRARGLLDRLVERAKAAEEEWSLLAAQLHQVELTCRVGDWRAARLAYDRLLLIPGRPGMEYTNRFRAFLAAAAGDVAATDAAVARVRAAADESGWQKLDAQRAAGLARLLTGDAPGAVRELRAVHRALGSGGVGEPGAIPVAADLVEALTACGRDDEARAVVVDLEAADARVGHPWAAAAAAAGRGQLLDATGQHGAAIDELADAAARYERLGFAFDAARARLRLGTAMRHARRISQARETLRTAGETFETLGCPPLTARATAEVARLGGRPRPGSGLTQTEARVAELVAAGMSNREVAATLVVSTRTVETHLTRIYAKLGLRSRSELARALLGQDPEPAVSPARDPRSPG